MENRWKKARAKTNIMQKAGKGNVMCKRMSHCQCCVYVIVVGSIVYYIRFELEAFRGEH